MGSLDALVLNAVDRAFKKRNFNPGNSSTHNQGRSGPAQGAEPKSQKQCTYCRRTGHGQDDLLLPEKRQGSVPHDQR